MGHAGKDTLKEHERPLLSKRTKLAIAALVMCLVLLSLLLFLLRDTIGHTLMRGDSSELETPHHITVGLDALLIEENAIRFDKQRHDGHAPRIDLALMWPEMRGYSLNNRNRFDDPTQTHRLIFLQITQSTMSLDMSGRIGPIYSQLFDGAPFAGPYGLTAHHLRPGSGYDGETLFTAARPGDTDYAIRCMNDAASDAQAIDDCQRDIRIGKDLSVLYRFSRKNLMDWQKIEQAVVAYMNQRLLTAGN
ncbi:hypothetical protein [Rhizobium sp.]|jgi:hypothetical protein|uniref:hypothetical protein n=1 Tax=Rhizobium sp. TaxID=391 RepID=UPI000E9BC84D|nr:hypothetical protein [Rhizobium sp.]